MTRKGENIYRRKDGRYEGRYIKGRKENGAAQYGYIYGKKYREVKHKLIEMKANVNMDTNGILIHGNVRFDNWYDYWITLCKKNRIKDSTLHNYHRMMQTHVFPHIESLSMKNITPLQIQRIINDMETKGCAPSTIRNVYHLIKSLFKDALYYQAIHIDPCVHIIMPKIIKNEQRVLSRKEQDRLQLFCYERYPEFLFCLWTGVRLGELCALTWNHIDLEEGIVYIEYTLQRINRDGKTQIIITLPKTDTSKREIPLSERLIIMLKQQKQKRNAKDSDYVFPSHRQKYSDPRTIQKKFQRVTQKLNLSNVHIHSLRHTFATRCIEAGIDFKTLSSMMGHSSAKTTMDVYVHTTLHQKKESIKKLELVL